MSLDRPASAICSTQFCEIVDVDVGATAHLKRVDSMEGRCIQVCRASEFDFIAGWSTCDYSAGK